MESVVANKSKDFAIKIIHLYQYLCSEKKEYVLSKQILRSGTSIGANIREATYAQSTNDFVHKFSIARKEANETEYWLELLSETGYITKEKYEELSLNCVELLKLLTSIIKSSKKKGEC